MWYPFRERPARFCEEGCRRACSRRGARGGSDRRGRDEGRGGGERVPRGPSKEASTRASGLRRRGLFVPRRDAFGASYLRVTPCNRAPASVFSFLLFLSCSLPLSASRFHRDNSLRRSLHCEKRKRTRERKRAGLAPTRPKRI